jgi:glycosyltransferase involved in cell wall biosynthesis
MADRPRVSVVIPSFNNATTIAETMDSVLGQTFPDFELIVSDHASDDGTWRVLQRYSADPRVQLLRIEPGGGASRNWNRVTEHAKGELLKLVCGDDLLRPDALARQVGAYDDAGSGIAMVASPRDVVDHRGHTMIRSRGLGGLRGRIDGVTAIRRTVRSGTNVFGEPCCALINRVLLQDVGGWDGRYGYFIDLSTYMRLLAHGDLVALPETLASFRVSAGQWSVRLAAEQAGQARRVFREVHETLPAAVSAADVRLGTARARLLAAARRALYFRMSRVPGSIRLRPSRRADHQ